MKINLSQSEWVGTTLDLQILRICVLVSGVLLAFTSAASADPVPPAVPLLARPLPLSAVRLTGGPLKHAQDLDADYLLKLEPDRMLAHYRTLAGLAPKAKGYGGWDADGRQLTGHIAGHYLSAVSLMVAATGDERFHERADYIVAQLKEIQDAHGNGFAGALENCQERFAEVAKGDIRSGGFDLNGLWSPWYTLHKTFAGLRDAYRHTGNQTALDVEVKFAEWAAGILKDLDDTQIQKMLNTEFGGMNEVLVDLYVDTGDRRWLDLSYKFEHRSVVDPLQHRHDPLEGIHANTQVPKLIGSLSRYVATGNADDETAAEFFWERVVDHHSFASGGHGKDEYFGAPDRLNDFVAGRTAETCNVYNMLKLTRQLFALQPDEKFAAFAERALFNHILASIDPEDGRMCYMVPIGPGVQHEYQDMFRDFTCCVGSGMESHALHGDGIYYENGDRLWINLYTPSTAEWKSAGAKIEVATDFPIGESARISLQLEQPRELTLSLRRPAWAGEEFTAAVNGEPIADLPAPGNYLELKRTWHSGDTIELRLPKQLHLEPLPDNKNRVAILWGPLMLVGNLDASNANDDKDTPAEIPVDIPIFVTDGQPVDQWLKPSSDDKHPTFRTVGVGRERDVDFTPFYQLHRHTYGGYWDLFTTADWQHREAELRAAEARERALERVTIGVVQLGNMQSERDVNFQSDEVWPLRQSGRSARHGRGWFSVDLPVESADNQPTTLVATFHGGHRRTPAVFRILIDGQPLAEQTIDSTAPDKFFDVEYKIPPELLTGKPKTTIRIESKDHKDLGPIFSLRTIRNDAKP